MIGLIKGTMRQAKEVGGLPLPIASYKANMKGNLKSLNVAINATQSGSGDPYPAGGSAQKWDEEWEVGGFNPSTGAETSETDRIRTKNMIPVEPNTSYYLFYPSGKQGSLYVFFYNDDTLLNVIFNKNAVITTPASCNKIKFNTQSYYGNTYNHDIAINYPSSVTTYSPYSNSRPISGWSECNVVNGNTYTIQLGDTYYGGSLDVTTGVLTVTHTNIASYAGESINEPWICSEAVYSEGATPPTGSQVVYPLATPITVQLTPTQVEQLLGANNVWADTGDVEELKYFDRQVYYGR